MGDQVIRSMGIPLLPAMRLKLLQDSLDAGNSDGLELGLDLGVGDLAVVDNGSPSAVAVTWSSPTDLLGELGLEVAGEDDKSVVVWGTSQVDLLPAAHDIGVVWCDDDEVVNALLL